VPFNKLDAAKMLGLDMSSCVLSRRDEPSGTWAYHGNWYEDQHLIVQSMFLPTDNGLKRRGQLYAVTFVKK